ncbi:hypothetical protein QUF70_09910 [Desulfobacterales bacterium HSG17]|nr:hypothetical protein [Desulfobacterales bacterium HSG17]
MKQEFIEKMEAQLKNYGIEIDELKKKAAEAGDDLRARLEDIIKDLMQRREMVVNKLQELKRTGDEAWVDLQVHVENAGENLRSALESALAKIKKGD